MTPVALLKMEDGEVSLSLNLEQDTRDTDPKEIVHAELPKSVVAILLDLEHRGCYSGKQEDENLMMVIWDTLPTMIAKALAPK
jgi:hypothetical protein